MGGGPPSSNYQTQQNKKEISNNNQDNDISKNYQKPSENPFSKKNQRTQILQPSPSEPEMENISVVVQEDANKKDSERPIRPAKKNDRNENSRNVQKDIINNHDDQVLPAGLTKILNPKLFHIIFGCLFHI